MSLLNICNDVGYPWNLFACGDYARAIGLSFVAKALGKWDFVGTMTKKEMTDEQLQQIVERLSFAILHFFKYSSTSFA